MSLRVANISAQLAAVTMPEREITRLLRHRRNAVIFDIGACEGEDSIRYARRFPHGKVYSFEPLPANQVLVRANLARHCIDHAELVPLALSNRPGVATFHVSAGEPPEKFAGDDWNYGNKSSSLLPPAGSEPMHGWLLFPTEISVACDTLDGFCAGRGIQRVDFIHMDVQGAEWLVLQGSHRMLPSTTAVWLEVANAELYRGQRLRSDIERFMTAAGFAVLAQDMRGVEGDQFYVNRRLWRCRMRLAARRATQLFTRIRFQLGRFRSRLSPSP
ncbi:MAG: FkbM family methyltransferase [Opitutaceae bacterium]|nr:FkbM family methyltransferase [Opitutaceae bacterium]